MVISLKITILSEMKNKRMSIIDWDLHQKLQKKTKIETEYKYKKPNGRKPGFFKRIIEHLKKVFQGLNDMRKNGHSPRN